MIAPDKAPTNVNVIYVSTFYKAPFFELFSSYSIVSAGVRRFGTIRAINRDAIIPPIAP